MESRQLMSGHIRPADFAHPSVQALLDLHFQALIDASPLGKAHVLDLAALQAPDICTWVLWSGDRAVSTGALRHLSDTRGEIKSMRTHPDYLGQGHGAAMLEHIVGEARQRGYRTLSLGTGTGPAFDPALHLYRRRGFVSGPAFGTYQASDFNQFLHLSL